MDAKKEMYMLLEDMVRLAPTSDTEGMLRLNEKFDRIYLRSPERNSEDLLVYDRCRQSCVVAQVMPHMRDALVYDAQERFAKIPRP